MPFTSAPSRVVRDDPRRAAIAAAAADDSYDARTHLNAAIKRPCPVCPALVNERCHDESYPSGRAKTYSRFLHTDRRPPQQARRLTERRSS